MEALVLAPLRPSHSIAANPGAGAGTGRLFEHQESAADKRQLPWPGSCRRWVAASPSNSAAIRHRTEPTALGLGARQNAAGWRQNGTNFDRARGNKQAGCHRWSHCISQKSISCDRNLWPSCTTLKRVKPKQLGYTNSAVCLFANRGRRRRQGKGRKRTGGGRWVRTAGSRPNPTVDINSPKPSRPRHLVVHPGTSRKGQLTRGSG